MKKFLFLMMTLGVVMTACKKDEDTKVTFEGNQWISEEMEADGDFPAGKYLEELAVASTAKFKIKPTMKGAECCLSGIENKCRKMLDSGEKPEDIALFCLKSVEAALCGMTDALISEYGKLPLIYAGGVMSNKIIRKTMEEKYGGIFAKPEFSSDNAAGIAVLTAIAAQK